MELVIGISAVVGTLVLIQWESDRIKDVQTQSDELVASSLSED